MVYEKNAQPGGLLTYGIPNMKLDKEVVFRRIRLLEEAGITFHCNVEIGKDVSKTNWMRRMMPSSFVRVQKNHVTCR